MKLHSAAADRNCEPICSVLKEHLPEAGTVLEIAAGSGQHACFMARMFPQLHWQPTDMGDEQLRSIEQYRQDSGLTNLLAPKRLDVTEESWPVDSADAIVCVNMVHISPWQATIALLDGATRVLSADGILYLYGPYFVDGIETAPSNFAFDASLQARNQSWGIRKLSNVLQAASDRGLCHLSTTPMPANNYSVVLHKTT